MQHGFHSSSLWVYSWTGETWAVKCRCRSTSNPPRRKCLVRRREQGSSPGALQLLLGTLSKGLTRWWYISKPKTHIQTLSHFSFCWSPSQSIRFLRMSVYGTGEKMIILTKISIKDKILLVLMWVGPMKLIALTTWIKKFGNCHLWLQPLACRWAHCWNGTLEQMPARDFALLTTEFPFRA